MAFIEAQPIMIQRAKLISNATAIAHLPFPPISTQAL
jgi:hypothetical protein